MTPRQIIRNLQLGLVEPVLDSKMPWYCVECGVCLVRCPQQVDLPALNEAICRLAMRKKRVSVREGARFMNIFLDNVQRKGVSDEAMLAGRFNIETGHFVQDVASVPKMMQQGLLSLTEKGHVPKGAAEVRRIVRACRQAEAAKAAQVRAAEREQAAQQRAELLQARQRLAEHSAEQGQAADQGQAAEREQAAQQRAEGRPPGETPGGKGGGDHAAC